MPCEIAIATCCGIQSYGLVHPYTLLLLLVLRGYKRLGSWEQKVRDRAARQAVTLAAPAVSTGGAVDARKY